MNVKKKSGVRTVLRNKSYMTELHVLFVVDGGDGDLALRHVVVVVDVV